MKCAANDWIVIARGGMTCEQHPNVMWWFITLTRGKVHFEFMEDGWSQTGEGMAAFVEKRAPQFRHR